MEQHNLEQRLQNIEDEMAISRLKYRYLNACDEKKPDEVMACFSAGEIDIDFGHIGVFSRREDFVDLFIQFGCKDNIVDMHHAQNPIIEITGPNSAKGKVCLRFHSLDTESKTSTQLGGYYMDEYQRIKSEWLIVVSHFIVTSVELRDFSGEKNLVTYVGSSMPT